MRKCILIVVMLGCLMANTRSDNLPHRAFQVVRHDINQVEMCISNYGKFGQDETGYNQGCWWPIGTNHGYIWGAGIWFGTIDSLTGDTLVTVGYDPSTGDSEFAPGLAGWSVNNPYAVIYIYPEHWPASPHLLPMAPQDTISHEDSWCCFNDCDSVYHMQGDTRPIEIEVYQSVYAWDNWCCDDIIFFTYEVKNVSDHTLQNCYLGVCADCEVGSSLENDDRCSGILEREYVIYGDTINVDNVAYEWQEWEEQGTPPWFPGVIGIDLLQTPFDLVEGMDKDGDGILDQYERDSVYYISNLPASMWDVDNDGVPDWRDPSQWPQFGMTALKRFSLGSEPDIDPERYASLAGYDFVTGLYEPYDTIPPCPDDQRFLMASGSFDLASDSIVALVFSVMLADWHTFFSRPDTALALVDKWAQRFSDQYWFLYTELEEHFESRIANCGLNITPNPVAVRGVISYSLAAPTDVSLNLYNLAGQLVRNLIDKRLDAGKYSMNIDTHDLPLGTYFLVLETPMTRKSQSVVVVR